MNIEQTRAVLEKFPRLELGAFPTPLQPMKNLQRKLNTPVSLYIKRDDLTGLGPGGNKTRNLEYLLGEAVEQDCDVIFDVRFLDNPFYVDDLKEKTGQDKEVRDFVLNSKMTQEYIVKLIDYVDFMLKAYDNNGDKRHLTICVGCTGGQHRSVTIANYLYDYYKNKYVSHIKHRELEKR